MAYQYLPSDLARLQTEQEDIRRRQQMAQAFQQAGFNPVQGGNQALTLLASLASTLRGNSMMKDASKSLTENLAQQFEAQNAQAQAEAEAKRAEEDRKFQRELEKLREGEKIKAQYAQRNIDPLSPEGIQAALGLEQGKAKLRPQGAPPAEKGWQIMDTPQGIMRVNSLTGAVEPLKVGDKPLVGKTGAPTEPKALGAEAAAKVALYENALRDAQAYQQAVTNPDGSFNDIAANMPANVRLRESALRAKLRAESGASISPEEAKAENERYGPKLFSSDATNVEAVKRLIEDLQHQSATIRGGAMDQAAQGQPPASAPPSGAQQEYPDGTVIQNAQGQKMVMQGGQWVPQ